MKNFYFAVDVGGTNIKVGAVDCDGELLCSTYSSTKKALEGASLAQAIFQMTSRLAENNNLSLTDALGVGIGLPGLVDTKRGVLKYACNLGIRDYALKSELEGLLGLKVKLANDADVAALAELNFGAGKPFKNFVMMVVGTGIGACIVYHKKPLSTAFSGEIGHMKLSCTGEKCSCGEVGCYETLASTSALIRQTKRAMEQNPSSLMWEKYTPETVTGKTVFEFRHDAAAQKVLEAYISYLGDGIVSLVNVFMPEAIIIGGAISNQKENLLKPLEEYVNKHMFAKNAGYEVKILPAKFTGNAGLIGARYLF